MMARVVLLVIALALGAQPARAQTNPTYVQFENVAAKDIKPCVECETRKGQFANCTKNYFNYLRDWINQRFRQR